MNQTLENILIVIFGLIIAFAAVALLIWLDVDWWQILILYLLLLGGSYFLYRYTKRKPNSKLGRFARKFYDFMGKVQF